MEEKVINEVLNVKVDEDVVETGLEVIRDKNCKGKVGLIILGIAAIAATGIVIYKKIIKPRKQNKDNPITGDATACVEEDDEITVEVVDSE